MKYVGWDTETHLIQPGLLAPPIVCHSFAFEDESKPGHIALKKPGFYAVSDLLQSESYFAVANGAYDFACLLAERPDLFPLVWKAYEDGRVWDVQIAATLVAIAEGRLRDGELFDRKGQKMKNGNKITNRYSLNVCVYEWLGRTDAKHNDRFRTSYALLENVPLEYWPDDAKQYPVDDAVNTLQVAIAQRDSGFDFCDLKVQCHAAFCAHLQAVTGLRANPERVSKLKEELTERERDIQRWALELKLLKRNKDGSLSKDTKAIGALVHSAYGESPPQTPKGGVSLSRETLEDSGNDILEKFSEIGKVQKLLTYVPTLEEAARVPLNVKPNVLLSTGRASYEGMLQLLPRSGGIRECFQARGTYISCDYAAVELGTLAQVCIWTTGDSRLAAAINEGKDPHCIMGSNLNGMTYDEFFASKKQSHVKNLRQAAKAANFGFPGMMGAPKFTIAQRKAGYSVCEWLHDDKQCGAEKVTEWKGKSWDGGALCLRCIEVSATLKKTYLSSWTEIRPYWDWVMKQIEYDDKITQFVSKRVRGGVTGPSAANSFFQGLAADGAKRAVIAMTKEMYLDTQSPLYGSRLVVFSHDETIIDVPESSDLDAAGRRQATIMVDEMQAICPDVKFSVEPAACKHWTKSAEPKYDDKGKLIAWDL